MTTPLKPADEKPQNLAQEQINQPVQQTSDTSAVGNIQPGSGSGNTQSGSGMFDQTARRKMDADAFVQDPILVNHENAVLYPDLLDKTQNVPR